MTALRMFPTVRKVQSRIGYDFKNAHYVWEALQAPGSIVRSGEVEGAGTERHSVGFQRFPDGNRRLAVLGDTVLKLALVEDWYGGDGVRGMANRSFPLLESSCGLSMNRKTITCCVGRRLEWQSREGWPRQWTGPAHQQEPV